MPEYLEILREASVASIYILFFTVLLFTIFKGRITNNRFAILFYVWLPLAVLAQSLMTYLRFMGESNLPVMNIYLILEFILIVYILLSIRKEIKKTVINIKLWVAIIVIGISTHFLYDLNTIHNTSMLYTAIVYFQLTVNYIDLNKIEGFITDPFSLLHIAVFIKALGYSYFLIYQAEYTFPLSIYSALNLLVQVVLILTLVQYYKLGKANNNN